jgi:hypothetical protein
MHVKQTHEINARISEINKKLDVITAAIDREMSKPFFERDVNTALFLDIEKKIYLGMLRELEWVIGRN